MKQTIHRILAAALAACMLLGVTMSVSATAADNKTFGAEVTISKMPDNPTFVPDVTWPDLSGLELSFKLGDVERILAYDELYSWYDDLDWENLDWDDEDFDWDWYFAGPEFGIWLYFPEDELQFGENEFLLEVSVSNGKEHYIVRDIPIVLTGISPLDIVDASDITALRAGLPNRVVPVSMWENELALYSFTPRVSGWYSFSSSFSVRPRLPSFWEYVDLLYFMNPIYFFWFNPLSRLPWMFMHIVDPMGMLLDSEGQVVAAGYGSWYSSYDFSFTAKLEAGATYYFLPRSYGSELAFVVTPRFLAPALF